MADRNLSNVPNLDQIEAYIFRLHCNTVIDVSVNIVAAYLVLKHSTSAMQNYKFYIFLTIICTLIMDIHLTVLYGMFPLFPTPIVCAMGPVKIGGWLWGEVFNWFIVHVTLSLAGGSVVLCAAYQYFSLLGKEQFFHTVYGRAILISIIFIYPFPTIAMYLPCMDYEKVSAEVLETTPHLHDFYIHNACMSSVVNADMFIYWGIMGLQIALIYLIGILLFWRIVRKLSEMKNVMSENTMRMRRTYVRVLTIQASIPLFFIVIPLSFLLIAQFLGATPFEAALWLIQLFSLHSMGNALTIIFVIKPYREKLLQWLSIILKPVRRHLPHRLYPTRVPSQHTADVSITAVNIN